MPPIVALIGRPDCGKTTLLEKLLPELRGRGLRVGTIKHHVHDFAMDTPGKDTWRHKQAGARVVALSSPTGIGIIRDADRDSDPRELAARYFADLDLVIAEGYKASSLPKIEVFRAAGNATPLEKHSPHLIATVSDTEIRPGLPCFGLEDVASLADFLVRTFLTPTDSGPDSDTLAVTLMVNGMAVPLKDFVAQFIGNTVQGMVSSLKGGEQAGEIVLHIKPGPKQRNVGMLE